MNTAGTATRRASLGLGVALLAAGLAAAPGASAQAPGTSTAPVVVTADETVTWGVQPSPTDDEPSRPNFSYFAEKGEVITDSVRIRNFSAAKLPLRLYATDAKNAESGALDLLPAVETPKDAGRWIALEGPAEITLNSNQFVDIPFKIRVPDGAESGDHVAGIVTSFLSAGIDDKDEAVRVDRRLGTRVQIRIDGPLEPRLTVTDLKTSFDNTANPLGGGTIRATYTVTNSGNVRMSADQELKVKGPIGFPARTLKPPGVPELLPGSSIKLSAEIGGVYPSVISRTRVTLTPTPTRDGDEFDPDRTRATAGDGAWSWPWALLVLVLLLGAGGEGGRRYRKRREQEEDQRLEEKIDARLRTPARLDREATP